MEIAEKEYTLYFTRDAIVRMEKEGLDATKMDTQIVTTMRLLFWGAMLPLNPRLTLDRADQLLDEALKDYDLGDLFEALINKVEFGEPVPKEPKCLKKIEKYFNQDNSDMVVISRPYLPRLFFIKEELYDAIKREKTF